jgi:hypothetical protein
VVVGAGMAGILVANRPSVRLYAPEAKPAPILEQLDFLAGELIAKATVR